MADANVLEVQRIQLCYNLISGAAEKRASSLFEWHGHPAVTPMPHLWQKGRGGGAVHLHISNSPHRNLAFLTEPTRPLE
eukprot:CAMPEP_0172715124 /NCGR_PEP_ID=MMETSP1074-20121228/67367_1 /TAXON_ID=2916 /ORGANISM="Ceratium fusus, Strain PA161109" /LENGTH=78 /DNA_ID=CAMNT_0013539667 /DNA_START=335 /DNA_END=569 /DNA_ORIENTATION=+